ncbi:MAG: TetR/AcrR family transcriptional regulator [Bryobacteraceae bacterium]|nr:TetR/AcrR family transcriptional regulator [Bryobacteraceae bacterium]
MPYPSKTDRPTILATAMDQVSQHGIDKLAIRSVAAALGLAPNALYRYFSNLAALEAALAEESRHRLQEVLQRAAGKKSPEEAIRSIAKAYVRFAREQPQVFSLTLMPSTTETEGDAAHVQMWSFVLGHVAGIYGEKKAPEAAVALWAFLHGMTALEAARVFGERKPVSSFEFGLRMWIKAGSADIS